MAAAAAAVAESSISTLPEDVAEYARLHHEKSKLLAAARALTSDLKERHERILEQMQREGRGAYDVVPTLEEESKYGGLGALKLKVR